MANLKAVTEAQKVITKIIKIKKEKSVQAVSRIAELDKKLFELDAMSETLAKNGDIQEYMKAKRERESLQEEKQMFLSQKKAFEEKALISAEEYAFLVDAILSEYEQKRRAAMEDLEKLSLQMLAISEDMQNAFNEANDTLHNLQHDLFKDQDRAKTPSGVCYNISDEKVIRNRDVIEWGKVGISSLIYSEYLRTKG